LTAEISRSGRDVTETAKRNNVLIMGAGGRDFHNFNVVFRKDPSARVVAFTAAQIPGIAGRVYPPELAGPLYPSGIPIVDEPELETLCRRHAVDTVVFAYSDVSHEAVMHAASRVLALGADFLLLGPRRTMLSSTKPVIAVTAVRTGCGKSQTARFLSAFLRECGMRTAIVRHPMPYGDLSRQRLQRFATMQDVEDADCTSEEREEYEPHIAAGGIVFAGIDSGAVLNAVEKEADIVLWDGGNNDFSFVRPDLHIVVADALRPNQALHYHPGEAVLRSADIVVLNKTDSASPTQTRAVVDEICEANPTAPIVRARSPISVDDPSVINGRRVLVVEDGPTITHGGAPYGAGYVAAKTYGASEIVDPRLSAPPELLALYRKYPHIGPVLPDVGYGKDDRRLVKETIDRSSADVVLVAAPLDLKTLLDLDRPVVRARYDFAEQGEPRLTSLVGEFLRKRKLLPHGG
jgi:predicted GTPase